MQRPTEVLSLSSCEAKLKADGCQCSVFYNTEVLDFKAECAGIQQWRWSHCWCMQVYNNEEDHISDTGVCRCTTMKMITCQTLP